MMDLTQNAEESKGARAFGLGTARGIQSHFKVYGFVMRHRQIVDDLIVSVIHLNIPHSNLKGCVFSPTFVLLYYQRVRQRKRG